MLSAQRGLERVTFRLDADHLTRDPIPYLRDAGFLLYTVSRAKAGISYRVRAHRPA